MTTFNIENTYVFTLVENFKQGDLKGSEPDQTCASMSGGLSIMKPVTIFEIHPGTAEESQNQGLDKKGDRGQVQVPDHRNRTQDSKSGPQRQEQEFTLTLCDYEDRPENLYRTCGVFSFGAFKGIMKLEDLEVECDIEDDTGVRDESERESDLCALSSSKRSRSTEDDEELIHQRKKQDLTHDREDTTTDLKETGQGEQAFVYGIGAVIQQQEITDAYCPLPDDKKQEDAEMTGTQDPHAEQSQEIQSSAEASQRQNQVLRERRLLDLPDLWTHTYEPGDILIFTYRGCDKPKSNLDRFLTGSGMSGIAGTLERPYQHGYCWFEIVSDNLVRLQLEVKGSTVFVNYEGRPLRKSEEGDSGSIEELSGGRRRHVRPMELRDGYGRTWEELGHRRGV